MSAVWGAVREAWREYRQTGRGLAWHAGGPVQGAQVIATGARPVVAEQCPSCLREVLVTWSFCPDCSTALRGSRPAKVRPREYTTGGYRGGLPADQVGPPARLPSASMRPREYQGEAPPPPPPAR